jgi:GNAT superfamily N-acetyltransferase
MPPTPEVFRRIERGEALHRIRKCKESDFEVIWQIINDGAQAYKGVIPQDRWKEPYMSRDELRREMRDGVEFCGFEEHGGLDGVMGIQPVKDVTLIRHAYVRTQRQRAGIGARLLAHLRSLASGPVLIGTWADASWAIHFYEKHGFLVVGPEQKNTLLRRYWTVTDAQAAASVVLVHHDANIEKSEDSMVS